MQKYIFHKFFKAIKSTGFEVKYWDGSVQSYGQATPTFMLSFNKKIPFYKWINNPLMCFCEAYVNGSIDIEGSMDEIIRITNTDNKRFSKSKSHYGKRNVW